MGFFEKYSEINNDDRKVIQELRTLIQAKLSNKEINVQDLPAWLSSLTSEAAGLGDDSGEIVSYFRESIIEMLNDPDSPEYLWNKFLEYKSRYSAAIFIGWLGPKAFPLLPSLLDCIRDPGAEMGAVWDAILLIDGAEEKIMEAIETELKGQDDENFGNFCWLALDTSLVASQDLWNLLAEGLTHPSSDMRVLAAKGLTKMDAKFKQNTISLLRKLQNDEYEDVRETASKAISMLLVN